ncbi:SDR family oxidoreductase [Halalkalicoccus tibetensis]|uniref:SDR family oxidoreductase n=1 Tax=Halalkalicoccus tibetensis TaxID=175632 RepID=A0ABD5V458_9EURY
MTVACESGDVSPTVLITGCSSGIGHATALAFNERGWEVYATAPDRSSIDDLEEAGCHVAKLDVTDPGDAGVVADRIVDEQGRIDCLFNNAGYGQIGPLEELPTEQLREQFEVNYFGAHRVARAVLPYMREQGSGLIVNTSSVYGRTILMGQGAYASSKWALEALSDTLRVELSDHDVDVVSLEPGPVETEFGERAIGEIDKLERTGAYEWFYTLFDTRRYGRRLIDRALGHVQPEDVAEVVIEIAESEDRPRRRIVGPWKYMVWLGYVLPDGVRDRALELLKRLP